MQWSRGRGGRRRLRTSTNPTILIVIHSVRYKSVSREVTENIHISNRHSRLLFLSLQFPCGSSLVRDEAVLWRFHHVCDITELCRSRRRRPSRGECAQKQIPFQTGLRIHIHFWGGMLSQGRTKTGLSRPNVSLCQNMPINVSELHKFVDIFCNSNKMSENCKYECLFWLV